MFTFLTQVTVTSRVISRFGLASALVVLPVASAIGFGVIAVMPLLAVFIIFTIVRRVGEYALAKPAREVLFTVVSREEKYKAKNFIDTAVSRGGDAATGWIVNGVKALGATAGQMAWVLVPAGAALGMGGVVPGPARGDIEAEAEPRSTCQLRKQPTKVMPMCFFDGCSHFLQKG